jgi:hypothetical protein
VALASHVAILAAPHLRARTGNATDDADVCLAAALLRRLVASEDAALVAAESPQLRRNPAPVSHASDRTHAMRSLACMLAFNYCINALTCLLVTPLPDAVIRAALPSPPWDVWLRIPTTATRASQMPWLCFVRAFMIAITLVVAWAPGARGLSDMHLAFWHTFSLAYVTLVETTVCALATHARYGPGVRQPWQGGVRQLLVTALVHFSVVASPLPPSLYNVLVLLRALQPLAARASEGRTAAWVVLLSRMRLRIAQPMWDVLHALFCVACMVHNAALFARRRRAAKHAKLA